MRRRDVVVFSVMGGRRAHFGFIDRLSKNKGAVSRVQSFCRQIIRWHKDGEIPNAGGMSYCQNCLGLAQQIQNHLDMSEPGPHNPNTRGSEHEEL